MQDTHSDIIALLARALAPAVAAEIARLGQPAATTYSQHDGSRPTGCGRARYLRIWRIARDAGDPGATEDGRARLLTAEAYARHAATLTRRTPRAPKMPPTQDVDDVLAELGLAPKNHRRCG